MGLSRIVSEINGDLSRKSQFFPPREFSAPAEGVSLGRYGINKLKLLPPDVRF